MIIRINMLGFMALCLVCDLSNSLTVCHLIMLCFVLLLAFQTCWATFQVKNNVRSALASSAITLVSYRSHNTSTANRVTYTAVDEGMELKGEQR